MEYPAEEAKLAKLKEWAAKLLGLFMGEAKLSRWGYPDKDILDILAGVLKEAKIEPFTAESIINGLGTAHGDPIAAAADDFKAKVIRYRRTIYAVKANLKLLLCLLVPDQRLWKEYQWDNKPIDEILGEIMTP